MKKLLPYLLLTLTIGLLAQTNLLATVPSAPCTGPVYVATCNSFTATWGASTGATGYYIDVSTNSSFSSFLTWFNGYPTGNVTSYLVTCVSPGITYYYRVRAFNSDGTSANSSTMTFTVGAVPAAPTGSGTSEWGSGQATLTASCTTPGVVFDWYIGSTLQANSWGSPTYFSPTVSATTTYTVKSSLNGCESSGTNVTLTVYPEVQPVFASFQISGNGRTLNKSNYIPGTIGGSIDVSPTGAATYSIPIQVSPGSHGVQPSLGIVYSSQSGNDILGYGFHLSGISAITRVNKSQYYDGAIAPVKINTLAMTSTDDGLMLDGQRLIINSNYSNAYSPENDPYTVVQFNSSNNSFTLTSKDGTVVTYGNNSDNNNSQFYTYGGSNPYSWSITKMTDPNGNYMEYFYSRSNSTGEYFLSQIQYTGNGSNAPYNSVNFYYGPRSAGANDNNISYIAGQAVNQTLLLSSIKVYAQGTVSKDYEFTYFQDGLYNRLNQISLTADGVSYNPTIINWGAASNGTATADSSGSTLGALNKNQLYFGDFNGDGLTDILQWNGNTSFTIKLAYADGEYNTYTYTFSLEHYNSNTSLYPNFGCIKDISVVDWNNDGKDEIMVHYLDEHNACSYATGTWVCVDTKIDAIDYLYFNGSGFSRQFYDKMNTLTTDPSVLKPTDAYKYVYSDFNNDGTMDRLVVKNNTLISGDHLSSVPSITKIDTITTLDFDGDGQIEFLALDTNGYGSIWKYNGSSFTNVYGDGTTTLFGKIKNLFLGDFNGDGKTDYLSYANSGWNIMYSTGIGFVAGSASSISFLSNYEPAKSGKYSSKTSTYYTPNSIAITDVNNDGKADIIQTVNGNITIAESNGIAFPKKISLTGTTYTDLCASVVYPIDYDHDGQTEIIYGYIEYKSSTHENYQILNFNTPLDHNIYVDSITDGNNNTSAISYSIYKDNTSAQLTYPLRIVRGPMHMATNVTNSSGSLTLSNTTYAYSDGEIHCQGKGFLGFSTFSASNSINNTVSASNYHFTVPGYSSLYYTWPGVQTVQRIGTTISSVSNDTLVAEGGNTSQKLFLPLVTHMTTNDQFNTGSNKTTTINNFNTTQGMVTDQTTSTTDYSTEVQTAYQQVTSSQNPGNEYEPSSITTIRTKGSDTYTTKTTLGYGNASLPFSPVTKTDNASYGISNLSLSTTIGYDNYGNANSTSVTDGTTKARSTSCTFDSYGRFAVSSTDLVGNTSTATYRAGDGAKLTATDINGLQTTYSYSASGGIFTASATLPDGNISTTASGWDYSGVGLYYAKKSVTNGNTVTDYFNAAGQKLKETSLGLNSAVMGTTYTYKTDGSVATITNPGGQSMTYSYDSYGRESSEVGTNHNLSYSYTTTLNYTVTDNISGQTKTQAVDAMGNVTQITATTGNITYTYNAQGKVTNIAAAGGNTAMAYDAFGNQLTLSDPDAGSTTYKYNCFGQLTNQTDAKIKTTTIAYNQTNGQLISKTLGDNSVYTYSYYTASPWKELIDTVIHTDANSNKVMEIYTYDNLDRTTSIVTQDVTGGTSYTTSYTYDSYGRLATTTYPTGLKTANTYDAVGNVTKISKSSTSGTAIWTAGSQNSLGQWTKWSLGNGLVTNLTYGSDYQLTNIQTGTTASPSSVQNLIFSFNSAGQLTYHGDNINGGSESFTYDAMDRLTMATVGEPVAGAKTYSYSYDNYGDITYTSLAGSYSCGVTGHLHATLMVTGMSSTGSSPSVVTKSSYNAENMISTINNGTYSDAFIYGVNGNRFKVKFLTNGVANTSISSKVYVGNNEFGYGTNAYKRTLVYAPTGICAVYQDSGGVKALYYIHTDYQGSWLAITDSTGAVKNRYSYDAWGRPRDPVTWKLKPINIATALADLNTMQPRFDHGYTGHEIMAGFGLINMNGRLYDPYLQRFISPDPYVQAPDNSQSYNRYSYCMNNPLRYTDPTGYSWLSHFGHWIGGVAKDALNIAVNVVVDIAVVAIVAPIAVAITGITTVVGLGQLAFTGNSTILKNEGKIIGGLFTGSPGQILSRFTWELPQTMVGYTVSQFSNMIGNVNDVRYFHGATVVEYNINMGGSFTIGSYINLEHNDAGYYDNGHYVHVNDDENPNVLHEYGHYLQSQSVGPEFLFNYALPSLINASQFSDTDPEGQNKHNAFWVEQDADIRARNYFGDSHWSYDQYPILGDPRDPTDYTNNYGNYYNYMGSNWFENMYKWLNTAKN